jgi:hypothetical protein
MHPSLSYQGSEIIFDGKYQYMGSLFSMLPVQFTSRLLRFHFLRANPSGGFDKSPTHITLLVPSLATSALLFPCSAS